MPEPQLSLIVLRTTQVERLCEFYTLIGVRFIQEQHGSGPSHFAGRLENVVFEIYPLAEGETADRSTRLGFRIGQLDAVILQLTQAGVAVVSAAKTTQWGYCAVVRDPDGRSVELTEA
jgi:predicted enzyme related to lactoylglutathione lyase